MKSPEPFDLESVEIARVPEHTMTDEEVEGTEFEYSTRSPTDWVISGTLPGGRGPGRAFTNWSAAETWARNKYGGRLKGRIAEAATSDGFRWAFLIGGNGD